MEADTVVGQDQVELTVLSQRRRRSFIALSVVGAVGLLGVLGGIVYAAGYTPPSIPDELRQPQNVDGLEIPFVDLVTRQPFEIGAADVLRGREVVLGYSYDPTAAQQSCVRYDAGIAYTDDSVIVSLYSGFFEGYETYCPMPKDRIRTMAHASAYGSLVVGLLEPVGDRDIVDALTGAVLQPAPDAS